nr:MAG TPA: Protein of unknown function (DUF2800) [Caudoviricetes sp.]DAU14662.1 MAG TPA: Protein of unknown function (DUF2800) [Caudoviricetes sp.]
MLCRMQHSSTLRTRARSSVKFNNHSQLNGAHAFLSASKYHWLNYSPDKLIESFRTSQAAAKGTRLHELAAEHIRLKMRMPRNKVTFNNYVNDAIGFRMVPEQVLFYSVNCFGTADAISFDKGLLRIHDLKTGVHPAKVDQLMIYAALFCLEYDERPGAINYELRIYQNDDIQVANPEGEDIARIMDTIIQFDKLIEKIKEEEA